MKQQLSELLAKAIVQCQTDGQIASDVDANPQIEYARDKRFGDFASNIALTLTKQVGKPPREVAEMIIAAFPPTAWISEITIAGPGFINFKLSDDAFTAVMSQILSEQQQFGRCNLGQGKRVILEFISANPTGPLHVGHGRGAAFGASLGNLLDAAGYRVHREYYVNDAGRQMQILAASVWLRYLDLCGERFTFPTNGYQGDYVIDIARDIKERDGTAYQHPIAKVFANVPADEPDGGDKELHIDALIHNARTLCGEAAFDSFLQAALHTILDDIRDDLEEFGVHFDEWFSEKQLVSNGALDEAIARLQQTGHVYEKDGALWFNAVHFGDDKDRVLRRANGQTTYFASDVAYHMNKFDRGFDHLVDVFGADHHGYVARVKAAVRALGADDSQITIPIVQFAQLYRGKERLPMSTRKGEYVTIRQLRDDVGKDAARFFYVMRKVEQHMDFDLELAKSHSADNPVYYVQYAHARICSVMRQLDENELKYSENKGLAAANLLTTEHEKAILDRLNRYPEVIQTCASQYEPHQLAQYLRELANDFHTYYNAMKFIVDDENLRNARLCLIICIKQVLVNGLSIIGVSAPETM